ncbi:hypothetical protein ACLIBH_08640 [Virgibacillus sp. W0430]|uniref:hypothetical protein n=1 Tax=Virgibacillus sp. W0430 TaxID=3391580 RepID=UPI003F46094B
MIFWNTFLYSVQLPRKNAVFKLNRIGMDIVVIYMFMLLFIVSIPSFFDQLANPNGFSDSMSVFFFLIYFFIFYYLPLTVIVFALLSIIAFIGTKLATFFNRKLHFSVIWKAVALSTTNPFLIYAVLSLIFPIDDRILWFGLLYVIVLLFKIIFIYPERRRTRSS